MIGDYFQLSMRNLKHQGTRSWLTMVGIFIGIATIVSLISLGQGMQDAINNMFAQTGYNLIYVMPGAGMAGGASQGAKLTDSDMDVIQRVRGVNLVGGIVSKLARLESKGDSKFAFVIGMPTDKSQKIVEDMQNVKIAEGRFFKPDDKYAVGIGYRVANGDFFDKPVKVGDSITLNNKSFKVVGTLEKIGTKQDDEQFYIPIKTAQDVFDDHDDYMAVMIQTKEGFKPSDVAENIKDRLRKHRDVKEGDEDFSVQTMEQMVESFGTVLNAVQIVFLGIAGISLLVGGVGIMNTMYTSVLERTREIGVMKAVGARNRDILSLFLIDSGLIGLTGGLVGVIIGLSLSKSVEYIAKNQLQIEMLEAHVSWQLIFGALAFSFIVGCVSGVLPAKQAAELNPTEALRYE